MKGGINALYVGMCPEAILHNLERRGETEEDEKACSKTDQKVKKYFEDQVPGSIDSGELGILNMKEYIENMMKYVENMNYVDNMKT